MTNDSFPQVDASIALWQTLSKQRRMYNGLQGRLEVRLEKTDQKSEYAPLDGLYDGPKYCRDSVVWESLRYPSDHWKCAR